MEQLIKLLEDIKGALPLMIKLKAIDESAYKTLNESISEAIILAKNNIVQADVNGQLPLCYHHYEARDTQWMTCIKCGDIKPILSGNFR